MQFGYLLNGFKGPLRLMHGSNSGVCTSQQVKALQREFPKAQVLEVAGAAHPVPFNAAVNQFVLQSLNLPVSTGIELDDTSAAAPVIAPSVAQQTLQETVAQPKPASPPQVDSSQQPVQPRVGLLGFIKQLLGATKK